jgi:hypothetical protein
MDYFPKTSSSDNIPCASARKATFSTAKRWMPDTFQGIAHDIAAGLFSLCSIPADLSVNHPNSIVRV